jgi:ribosome recycling factor
MRKLTGLLKRTLPWKETTDQKVLEQMPTFQECFRMTLTQGVSRTADESRIALRTVRKLKKGGDLELTDEEFRVLKERLEINAPQFITAIHGQLLEKLDDSHA